MHLHISTESAGLRAGPVGPGEFDQLVTQSFAFLGRGSRREVGAIAGMGVGGQGELGYLLQPIVDIAQAPVHASELVGKDPVVEQLFQKTAPAD